MSDFRAISGLDDWVREQSKREQAMRAAFDTRVRVRETERRRARSAGERTIPPPLRCVACGEELKPSNAGIETPRGSLLHTRCRVSVHH